MRLSKVSIHNYRCFVSFETQVEDFTAIIGRNNAGKTSLVHALELLFHRGTDRSIPVIRDDFRQQDREIVIEAIFDSLDKQDVQAFFSLRGSPGVDEVGVRLEARWEDGMIVSERHLIRPDKDGDERKVERYGRRYGQFVFFDYVSPYRYPERATQLGRSSDYRRIVSTFAGDFIQPIEALSDDIRLLHQEIQDEISLRGGIQADEYDEANELVSDVIDFVRNSIVFNSATEIPDDFAESLEGLEDRWTEAGSQCLRVLEEVVKKGGSVSSDVCEKYTDLDAKVLKLIHRCQAQARLLELRDTMLDHDDFEDMEKSLSSVLDLLLPEMPPTLRPFPIQDDRLLGDVLVRLGDTDLPQCGSGYQSTFSIGLMIARILGEARTSRDVQPRILMIAVEEPEAHLHPHKQRHLMSALQRLQKRVLKNYDLKLQVLVTTHSSNVLSGLSFEQVLILRRRKGVTQPTKLARKTFLKSFLDEMNVTGADRRVRTTRLIERKLSRFFRQFSESLFARFTLILEGYSELGAFPVWARHLQPPNDLDQLGISLIVGGGSELSYAAKLLEKLDIDYLLVCDREDEHDLSMVELSNVKQTDHGTFEEEIFAVLSMGKVLRAIEATLTEDELDGLCKHLASPAGLELNQPCSWDDIVSLVEGGGLGEDRLERLKEICTDHNVPRSQRRNLLKGADIGALLAAEAETIDEIPPAYSEALQRAQKVAKEILNDE